MSELSAAAASQAEPEEPDDGSKSALEHNRRIPGALGYRLLRGTAAVLAQTS